MSGALLAYRVDTGGDPPAHSKPQWYCLRCEFDCYLLDLIFHHLKNAHGENPVVSDLEAGRITQFNGQA
ncbi:MAG: hypothetical protein M1438_18630 [Deltaproteobacteria bacterium]|nr:hypothetical protein [Deltaproteobacteria bacterium]